MNRAHQLLDALAEAGIHAAYGVPDSLLSALTTALSGRPGHVVAPNEGAAIGLAAGHFLATSCPAMVYMQNSGLGNAVNPLVSLAQVYDVPMLLVIGWRAEVTDAGQVADEPQHHGMGQVTLGLLEVLRIPYRILDADTDVRSLVAEVLPHRGPTALVVRRGALGNVGRMPDHRRLMSREEAIAAVLSASGSLPIVATTGFTSRELSELRARRGEPAQDFLTVGSMGHALAITVALADTGIRVICLDGDGAALMHLGTLALAATRPNVIHVVMNNGAHDSVGGQPTAAPGARFAGIARALGYDTVITAASAEDVAQAVRAARGSTLIEVMCRCGVRTDLGRPRHSPIDTREAFEAKLRATRSPQGPPDLC